MGAPVKLSPIEQALLAGLPDPSALRGEFSEQGLPHRRVEAWKWSDLRTAVSRLPAEAGAIDITGSREPDARTRLDQEPTLMLPRLAAALGRSCAVYDLTDGETLALTLEALAGAGHAMIAVNVPAGVTACLNERYVAQAGAFANIAVLITLGEGARLTRIVEQVEAPDAVLVVTCGIELSANARAAQTTLGFGAKLARLETHVDHAGGGAELRLDGAYLVGDGLHLDQTTLVRHEGAHGVTEELFKGAAARGGRGVFQGKIYVAEGAQKTDAQMQHRGLLLDEKAEIDAKPELEIYADDVVCAHGNAFGAIDEDALFYMRQRGLPEATARALLTESFLAEPLERIEDDATRERLLDRLRNRLTEMT